MFQLKPISKESIPAAIEKAERYRLLDEPNLAESICLDILEADPQSFQSHYNFAFGNNGSVQHFFHRVM